MKGYAFKDGPVVRVVITADMDKALRRLEEITGERINRHEIVILDEDSVLTIEYHVDFDGLLAPLCPDNVTITDDKTRVLWDHVSETGGDE